MSGSCRTEHIQELAVCSFVCLVPLESGSFRTEHTQELAVCSFVCLVPLRTGNTQEKSVCVPYRVLFLEGRVLFLQGQGILYKEECMFPTVSCSLQDSNTQELRN